MASTEIEITQVPPVAPDQAALMDLHSVLNVLNVLHGELTILGLGLAGDPELLGAGLRLCEAMRAELIDPAAALRHVRSLPDAEVAIERMIAAALDRHPRADAGESVRESLGNIRAVFRILEVRGREILARSQAPHEWLEMPIAGLLEDFRAVFSAIEKHSRGRYRIIYNLARQETSDYYVDFVIESEDGRPTVVMPMVFKDVMRDLIANARKYTAPGGAIGIGLFETPETLKFTVQDTGRGIPAGELQTVVHYGQRGSNVAQVRTLGGGFGLTKAFFVTKQFGGRFWIRSEVGVGTRIRIEIPRPARGNG